MTVQNALIGTFRAVAVSSAALLFGAPAQAQSISPSDFIALLTVTCNDLENQPDAILADAFNSETGSAARTSDGAILRMNGAEDIDGGYIQYNGGRYEYDGGTTIYCAASVLGTDAANNPLAFADMLDAQAADILGADVVTSGSPFLANGERGLMRQWATPDFPPSATLSLSAARAFISINIVRNIPD